MAGATPVQRSPLFVYFQDQDTGGRFHSGRYYSTDDLNIISLAPSVGNITPLTVEHRSIQYNDPDGIHY